MMRSLVLAAALGLLAAPVVVACDANEGPFEEAGEELDQAADDIEDAVN